MIQRRTLIAAAAAACATASTAYAQTATLNLSNWVPPTHPVAESIAKWVQAVEKESQGRVKIATLPKAVATPQAHYNAVRDGLADVSFTVIGYTPGRFPLSEIAELPLSGDSAEANSVAFQRITTRTPALLAEYKDVKVLALFTHGPGVIFNSKKEVQSVADLKGLKFRVGGGVINDVAKLIDANTAIKPATESYELLSTGVMDGVFLPFESVATYKIDKLLKYATTFPGGLYNSTFIVMMNKKAFDALPKQDQAVIDKLSGEPFARSLGRAFDARDREGKALAQASGIKITAAPPAMVGEVQSKIGTLETRWYDLAKGKGVANPQAVLADFRAETKKP